MTWPWVPLRFHHLPLCTFQLPPIRLFLTHSANTSDLALWFRVFTKNVLSTDSLMSHSLISFKSLLKCHLLKRGLFWFSEDRATSPTSSISFLSPSSVVVTELISLSHIQLNINTFTYVLTAPLTLEQMSRGFASSTQCCISRRAESGRKSQSSDLWSKLQFSLYKDLGKKKQRLPVLPSVVYKITNWECLRPGYEATKDLVLAHLKY